MSGIDHEGAKALVESGAQLLRAYMTEHETRYLKKLAPIIVDLRSLYRLEDGRPDWSGRSPEYRRAISTMYQEAQVPQDRMDTVQAALRYHVGNLLRERAGGDELAAVGLTAISPSERLKRNRDALSAQREVAAPRQDAARLTAYAQALVEYVDEAALSDLPPDRLVATRLALESIQSRAAQLLVRLADAAAGVRPSTRGRHRRREAGLRGV